MYDKNNHLIGVTSGDPQEANFEPNTKTAFEMTDYEVGAVPDHLYIVILASDWGNYTSPDTNSSELK
jgi:hypothetical protein